ncbi:efflux RND transporter permease subunit [bacterium]|nr:efflux RND transporter permease subunit [bacterium]
MKANSGSIVYDFFFKKTTFCILTAVFLVIAGLIAYNSMIKEANPDLEIPQALVFTEWPGASPELVEKEVTSKIEDKIKSIKGLKRYRSGSSNSASVVSVEFHADTSMGESMQLLRSKVAEAESYLPKNAKKPYIEPILMSDFPIISFQVYGELNGNELNFSAKKVKDRLAKIPGVKKVDIEGDSSEILQISLKPDQLSALQISPYLVVERIKTENIDLPWGQFDSSDFNSYFELSGRFQNIEDLKKLPIIHLDAERVINLEDIAEVSILQNRETTKAYFSKQNGPFTKTISLSIYKLPGKDTIRIIKKAKNIIEQMQKSSDWPKDINVDTIADESKNINSQLKTIFNNIWQAMVAVSLVLFIMLSWREALIATISVPLTFLGAVALLWVLGFTINELVIIGMVIALGLLIDSFILMMEGMHDAVFIKKLPPIEAVAFTLRTYASPLLSGILTTIVVFLPLMTIGGVEGKFIRFIPITAAICLALSYFIAVFIATPFSQLVMRFKSQKVSKTRVDHLNDKFSALLDSWLKRYAIPNRKVAFAWCVFTLMLFFFSLVCVDYLPGELYPKSDGRRLGITVELPNDTSLEQSEKHAELMGQVLRQKPYFESVSKLVGMKSPFSLNSMVDWLSETHAPYLVSFSCIFVEKNNREKLGYEYSEELRTELLQVVNRIPGARLTMSPDVGGSDSGDAIQIEITGHQMLQLRNISLAIQDKLKKIQGVTDVRDNIGQMQRFVKFKPRREEMSLQHVDLGHMSFQMRLAMNAEKLGNVYLPDRMEKMDMWIGTGWSEQKNRLGMPATWEDLASIAVVNEQGNRVQVNSLVTPVILESPPSISRLNGNRTVSLMARNSDRTVNEIFKELIPELEILKKNWPDEYDYRLGGEVEATSETYQNMFKAFGIGLFLVFAILALLFDSFLQPLIIMFSVLFALIGTFCGFFLFWIPISFPAMFGIVALVGIVVNDAIVMIDTMNTNLKNGFSRKEAAASGSADRLRPILSTTITTCIGLVPLALSSTIWMPLCTAIIFGLIAATFFSLVLIPCLYVLVTPDNQCQPDSISC